MTPRRAFGLALGAWTLSMIPFLVGLFVAVGGTGNGSSSEAGSVYPAVATILFVLSFATMGAVLGWKRPSNPIGWLLSASGGSYAMATLAIGFHQRWADWAGSWLWGLGAGISATFVLLLFPTGTLPSRRWRPVAWVAAIGLGAFVLGDAFAPGLITGSHSVNPLGVPGPLGSLFKLMRSGFALVVPAAVASVVAVGIRFRRARDLEREQMKWLLYAAGVVLAAILAQAPITATLGSGDLGTNVNNATVSIALALIPLAIGVAVLRLHLYDIDVVINKTVVYASLAAFITAVYVAIVVGAGTALGHGPSKSNLSLSIVATAVVAVAFQPVRERIQKVANRLVYGKRATPYEVLAGFSKQVGETYAAEDVLTRMARALVEGTGAASGTVWLKIGSRLAPEASWPSERHHDFAPLTMPDGHLPNVEGVSLALPVIHREETLGALTVTKPPREPLTTTERKLAEDLARQAGLVLRNVGLTEQLLARLDEIEASRGRIVSAEEEERRRLERRIDEGTRRELAATSLAVVEAAALVRQDPEASDRSLEAAGQRTARALDSLRDVARGVYPPVLADRGLTAALTAHAGRGPIPASVHGDVGRLPEAVESTVYFCCLEALQNVVAHSGADRATIELGRTETRVDFSVADHGCGFDPASTARGAGLVDMGDRLSALGGSLDITSVPGEGTTVHGSLPLAFDDGAGETAG